MGFAWESHFECPNCGVSAKSTAVAYDRLGFPVCPECGAVPRPDRGRSHSGG